jgi:hypothetical protein
VLEHDGQQQSATQTRRQGLADADHLAVLHAIWTAETTPARHQHYRDLLRAALPSGHDAEPGNKDQWLWRTLCAAELAGQDPAALLASVIAERDLAGARDIPAVLDARLRHRAACLAPLPPGPWSAQVPEIADPARRAYLASYQALHEAYRQRETVFAAVMADREDWDLATRSRPGQHHATTRSCNHPNPQSSPLSRYSSVPPIATPTGKQPIDSAPVHASNREAIAVTATGITGLLAASRSIARDLPAEQFDTLFGT